MTTANLSPEIRANVRLIHERSVVAHRQNMLSMWTIYDRPRDYPVGHIARRYDVGGDLDEPRASGDAIIGELETIRESMMRCGLTCLMRDPNDHPTVLETWL